MKQIELLDNEMSVRLRNILRAAEISTSKECLEIGSENLLKYRHFGFKSIKELREILSKNGYELK